MAEELILIPKSLSQDLGVANPPFKVRDAKKTNQELGQTALPEGFVATPVVNYISVGDLNSFNEDRCDAAQTVW